MFLKNSFVKLLTCKIILNSINNKSKFSKKNLFLAYTFFKKMAKIKRILFSVANQIRTKNKHSFAPNSKFFKKNSCSLLTYTH